MSPGSVVSLVLGCALVLVNLNYTLLSIAMHRLREGQFPARLPLGIPLLGTAAALVSLWLSPDSGWAPLVISLCLADTGGPLWWLVAAMRRRMLRRAQAVLEQARDAAPRPPLYAGPLTLSKPFATPAPDSGPNLRSRHGR